MLFKPVEFENGGFTFCVDEKHFENATFRKTLTTMMGFPCRSFPQVQIQNDGVVWTENINIDAFSEWNLRFQFPLL